MIRPDISKLRKKYESLPKEKALAGIEKVILDYKRELDYFKLSDLNILNWLKSQTQKEYDEYMKPILQNKPPPYIHDNEPETPFNKRLNLQGQYNHLQRSLIALEGLKQEIQSRPSEEHAAPPAIEKLISNLKEAENKFCKNMGMEFPIKHFERLTTNNSKGDRNPFLTDGQFEAFIKRAFLKEKDIKKQTLCSERRKGVYRMGVLSILPNFSQL